jgi:hypothetical protein
MVKKMKAKPKIKLPKKSKFNYMHLCLAVIVLIMIGGVGLLWKTSHTTTFKLITGDTWSFVSPQANYATKGPHFGRGVIKPRYPVMGGKQRVTIAITDTAPVKKVTAILTTDTKISEPYELLPGSGTSYSSDWTGVWYVNDTYRSKYSLSIQATSTNGTTITTIPLK